MRESLPILAAVLVALGSVQIALFLVLRGRMAGRDRRRDWSLIIGGMSAYYLLGAAYAVCVYLGARPVAAGCFLSMAVVSAAMVFLTGGPW